MKTNSEILAGLAVRIAKKTRIEENGCHNWTGWCNKDGVPMMRTGPTKQISVRRAVWEMNFGEIPAGKFAMPKCLNKKCINPEHLVSCNSAERYALNALDPASGCHPENHWLEENEVMENILSKTTVESNGCMIWHGATVNGYPHMSYRGKDTYVRMVLYEFKYGQIPDGKELINSCHNRSCINPDHLYPGTHQDSIDERAKHLAETGRKYSDWLNHRKLNEGQVREIFIRCQKGESKTKIARDYNVSRSCIVSIAYGTSWSLVTRDLTKASR